MSVHLNIIRGTGLNKTIVSYRVNRSGARGPSGAGLPTGGLIGQFIRKTSDAIDFATEWFTATAADVGADPAGSAAAVQGNLDDHEGDTDNPHLVLSSQVAEDVFDNGTKTVDTVIDWANGAVQSINIDGVIINISATGWDSLAPTGEGKAQAGTLIITGGDTAEPTFDDVNQGQLPTYVAGFANVQELASLGPDGAIYNMWQVSNDQHVLLGADTALNGNFALWSGVFPDEIPDDWTRSNQDASNYITEHASGLRIVSDNTSAINFSQNMFSGGVGETWLLVLRKSNHISGAIRWQNPETAVFEQITGTDVNGTFVFVLTVNQVNLAIFRDNTGNSDYVLELVQAQRLF